MSNRCTLCGKEIKDGEEYFTLDIHREYQTRTKECPIGVITILSAMNLCFWCQKCWEALLRFLKVANMEENPTRALEMIKELYELRERKEES